jgi:hypothetical protein
LLLTPRPYRNVRRTLHTGASYSRQPQLKWQHINWPRRPPSWRGQCIFLTMVRYRLHRRPKSFLNYDKTPAWASCWRRPQLKWLNINWPRMPPSWRGRYIFSTLVSWWLHRRPKSFLNYDISPTGASCWRRPRLKWQHINWPRRPPSWRGQCIFLTMVR